MLNGLCTHSMPHLDSMPHLVCAGAAKFPAHWRPLEIARHGWLPSCALHSMSLICCVMLSMLLLCLLQLLQGAPNLQYLHLVTGQLSVDDMYILSSLPALRQLTFTWVQGRQNGTLLPRHGEDVLRRLVPQLEDIIAWRGERDHVWRQGGSDRAVTRFLAGMEGWRF